MEGIELTAEQEREAEVITDILLAAMQVEAKNIGRLLASKANCELFGQTEFQLRDILHALGTRGIDAVCFRSAKKGVPRIQHDVPGLQRAGQVYRLSAHHIDVPVRESPLRTRLLSL